MRPIIPAPIRRPIWPTGRKVPPSMPATAMSRGFTYSPCNRDFARRLVNWSSIYPTKMGWMVSRNGAFPLIDLKNSILILIIVKPNGGTPSRDGSSPS